MKYTIAFVVPFTLLVSTFAALAQEKDAQYTIVVPRGLVQYEGCNASCSHRIYGVEVHGESDWGFNFADVETMFFEKSGRSKNGLIEYEFRSRERWVKLRLPDAAMLEQFAAPGRVEGGRRSALSGRGAGSAKRDSFRRIRHPQ